MASLQEENIALAKRFMAAQASNDWEAVRDMMAPGSTWWIAGDGLGGGTWERDKFCDTMAQVLDQYAAGPFEYTPLSEMAEGNLVAIEARSNMKLKNGRTYSNKYFLRFEIEDGKITAGREYMDTKHAFDIFEA
jgi:hypothetical protein